MVTRTAREIDFSTFPESDGEPMAETLENMVQMIDLIYTLGHVLVAQGRKRFAVGGNQFLYYNEHNGRDHVSPDVYVALDVPPGGRATWKTWLEGKCPDVVFEITSPSTQAEDTGPKRELYARLGAREYYIYDPQQEMAPIFQGFTLRGGRLEPLPMLSSGGIWSPLLQVELRPMAVPEIEWKPGGTYLRVIDPATGQPIPVPEEEHRDLQVAQERLQTAQERLQTAQEQVRAEAQARLAAEERASGEAQARLAAEQARLAAEERAARAEAALQALRAEEAQRSQQPGPPHE